MYKQLEEAQSFLRNVILFFNVIALLPVTLLLVNEPNYRKSKMIVVIFTVALIMSLIGALRWRTIFFGFSIFLLLVNIGFYFLYRADNFQFLP